MENRIRLRAVLDRAELRHAQETGWWVVWTFVGSFMPMWLGALVLLLIEQRVALVSFASHGEFALYAAAILGPIFFHLLKQDRRDFVLRQTIVVVSLVGMVVATAVYVLNFQQPPIPTLNRSVVVAVTTGLLFVSLLLAAAVTFLDRVQSEMPDIRGLQEKTQSNLSHELDDLIGDNSDG